MPDDRITGPWPHGPLMNVVLGPVSYPVEFGDSTGYKKVASHKAPYALTVKAGYLWIEEASWVSGANMLMKIEDDESSPQVIVAARAVTTADDTGVWMTLTIADEGPVRAGAELTLSIDSGDATGEFNCLTVNLWCEPTYAPAGSNATLGA